MDLRVKAYMIVTGMPLIEVLPHKEVEHIGPPSLLDFWILARFGPAASFVIISEPNMGNK
jgi:hypothetical protein